MSPHWQPHRTSFIPLCCVREELEKPLGVAPQRDTHLSPKSGIVVQWSLPCSELAGLSCLSGDGSEMSLVSVPAPLGSVDLAACRDGPPSGAQRCGQDPSVAVFQKWGHLLYQLFLLSVAEFLPDKGTVHVSAG